MGAELLKEYLISLGVKDNVSDKLKQIFSSTERDTKVFTKNFAIAGAAVGGMLIAANTAIAKFLVNLKNNNDEVKKLAKETGKTEAEAFRLKTTLNAMGKTMKEIKGNASLEKVFKQLQEDADKMKPPDFSKGLEQVENLGLEFTRFKQSGMYAIQWIGHYLLKYLYQPMEKAKQMFKSFNDIFINSIPKWAEKIGSFMGSFVNIGLSVIRLAGTIFNAIKKIFDMIPKELKIVGSAIAALAMFIRAGPIGKLIMIITAALLLLEDFYVYLDGGNALLGGVWQKLIDIWGTLKDNGTIDKFKKGFQDALELINDKLIDAKNYIVMLYNKIKDSDAIENLKEAFEKAGTAIKRILEAIKTIIMLIITGLTDMSGSISDLIVWLLNEVPRVIGLISDIAGTVADAISWFLQLTGVKEIILAVITTLGLWTAAQWLLNAAMAVNPITWIIAGIIALITAMYLLVENWDKIKEIFINVWDKIKEAFSQIPEWFKEKFNAAKEKIISVFSNIGIWFKNKYNEIKDGARDLPSKLGDKFKETRESIQKNFGPALSFFKNTWGNIKETFAKSDSFFGRTFAAAMIAIEMYFGVIVDWFKMIWANIQLIFSAVKAVLSGDFQGAYDAVIQIWLNIINFFKSIVDRIKLVFAPIVDWFKDKAKSIVDVFSFLPNAIKNKFLDVVDKIKEAFSPIVDWFKEKVGNIAGFFGGIGDKAKGLFGQKSSPSDDLTGHSDGGIFDKAHIAHVSEDNQPEAIIPLNKPTRAKEVLKSALGYMGINSSKDLLDKTNSFAGFAKQASGLFNSLENTISKTPTNYAGNSSTVINNTFDMKSSYNIKDTSGRPEATANAVDRTMQIRIRNLKGILN